MAEGDVKEFSGPRGDIWKVPVSPGCTDGHSRTVSRPVRSCPSDVAVPSPPSRTRSAVTANGYTSRRPVSRCVIWKPADSDGVTVKSGSVGAVPVLVKVARSLLLTVPKSKKEPIGQDRPDEGPRRLAVLLTGMP